MMTRCPILLASVFAVAVVASFEVPYAEATESRLAGMGNVDGYTKDDTDVFFFPGSIVQHNNLGIGELRAKNQDRTYSFGVHHGLGENSVFGIHLNRHPGYDLPRSEILNRDLDLENAELTRELELFFALRMSGADLGFRLGANFDSYKQDRPNPEDPSQTVEYMESTRGFRFGVGLSQENVDLGAHVILPNAAIDEVDGSETTWNGLLLELGGRAFLGDQSVRPVVLGHFGFGSSKIEHDPRIGPNEEVDFRNLSFGAGIGAEAQLDASNLLVIGFDLLDRTRNSEEYDDPTSSDQLEITRTTTILPRIRAGIESQVHRRVRARIGAVQTYSSSSVKTERSGPVSADRETSSRDTDFLPTFGLSVLIHKFTIDAVFNEGLLFDGPNFISGTTEPVSTKLSVTYEIGD